METLVLTDAEAAKLLGVSVHTLRKDRITARRIPFTKIGDRVFYRLESLRAMLAANETGGPAGAKPRRRGRG